MGMQLLVLCLLSAAPLKVASLGVTSTGLDPKAADAIIERFATQLAKQGEFSITSSGDIAQVLGLERQKQLLGCSESGCTAEIAAALGVDAILVAIISKTAKSVSTTVRVLNAGTGKVIVQDTHRGPDTDSTQDWLEGVVPIFAQRIRQELGGAPEQVAASSRASPSTAVWVVGAVSLALAAGSAVAFGLSAADAGRLKSTTPLPLDEIDSLEQSAKVKRWVGVGLLAGAGVGLVTTLVLWLTGSSSRVSVFFSPGTHGAFAGVQGAW